MAILLCPVPNLAGAPTEALKRINEAVVHHAPLTCSQYERRALTPWQTHSLIVRRHT